MKIKLFTGPGTRRWPRFRMVDVCSVRAMRSSSGREIQVENISRGGALLHTRKRFAPGTRIPIRLATIEGEIPLTCLVLRSSMSSRKGTPRYRTAVVFASPLPALEVRMQVAHAPRYSFTGWSSVGLCPFQNSVSNAGPSASADFLAVAASSMPDPSVYELNNW